MPDPIASLPAEISLRILLELPLGALATFQAVSPTWRNLIQTHDALVFSRASGYDISISGGNGGPEVALKNLLAERRGRYFGTSSWHESVDDWRTFCQRQTLLARNRVDPSAWRLMSYDNSPPQRLTWRLKADVQERILITTGHAQGVWVADLDTNEPLWSLPQEWPARPYAHLEYADGIAVWDRLGDELEVWKHDPSTPRGHLTHVGLLPAIDGMRGFHLKDGILAIVSDAGTTTYYDLRGDEPELLRKLTHSTGAIGYLDKTPSTLVLCHGDAVRCYDPFTGIEQGVFPPSMSASYMHYVLSRPDDLVSRNVMARAELVFAGSSTPREMEGNPLDPDAGEWKACHVDGDKYLVLLSNEARLFVCTDYERVLATPEGEERDKIVQETCCFIEISPGEEEMGDDDTNWLCLCEGRAAFGIGDHIVIVTLPSPGTNVYPSNALSHALALPTHSLIPPSCLALTPDALFATHGSAELVTTSTGRPALAVRKTVKVAWFNGEKVRDDERDAAAEDGWEDIEDGDEAFEFPDFDGDEDSDDEEDNSGNDYGGAAPYNGYSTPAPWANGTDSDAEDGPLSDGQAT